MIHVFLLLFLFRIFRNKKCIFCTERFYEIQVTGNGWIRPPELDELSIDKIVYSWVIVASRKKKVEIDIHYLRTGNRPPICDVEHFSVSTALFIIIFLYYAPTHQR